MRTTRIPPWQWLAISLASVAPLASATAQESDRPAEWAPADAVFFIGSPDVHDAVEAGKKTVLKDYFEDPDLKDTRDTMFEQMREAAEGLFESLGMRDLENIEELGLGKLEISKLYPHGGACVFGTLESAGSDETEPSGEFQFVAEMGKNYGELRELVEKLTKKFQDRKFKRETTRFRGTTIVTLIPPADEESDSDDEAWADDDEEDPSPIVYAFHKKTFLLGSDVDLTKQTLLRMTERKSDCLAASSDYTHLSRTCSPVGQLRVYVNLPRIFKIMGEADPDYARGFAAWGLSAWKPLVGTLRIGRPKGVVYTLQMNLPLGSTEKGLGKILAMKNRPVSPPKYIDADTAMLVVCNLAAGNIFDEILVSMERFDADTAQAMRAGLDVPWGDDGETINVRNDLIGLFEGPFTISIGLKKPFGANSIRILVAMAHKNRAGLEKLFNALTGGPLKKRDMLGQQVYEVAGPMMIQGLALAVTERLFVAGSNNSIGSAIRAEKSEAEGLAGEEAFTKIAEYLPDEAWLTIYYDSQRLGQFLIDLTKKTDDSEKDGLSIGNMEKDDLSQSIAQILPMLLMMGGAPDADSMEASLKYEGSWVMTATTRGKSIDFQVVGVSPERAKK
ncbi:MAG: hypothetical protein O7F76_08420 [Planctomycetota bacterium]|nr:hypothetical protein [Planctomycetota bacterium]